MSEQLDTQYYALTYKHPATSTFTTSWACPVCTSRQLGSPKVISQGGAVTNDQPGRDESVAHVQAIIQTTSRPTGGQPSRSPRHLPSFSFHFRDMFRTELCIADQPSLSQHMLEPNLLGEGDSSSTARGLISAGPSGSRVGHDSRGLTRSRRSTVLGVQYSPCGIACFH